MSEHWILSFMKLKFRGDKYDVIFLMNDTVANNSSLTELFLQFCCVQGIPADVHQT